jgi:LPS sulfotransferase NodH
MRGFHDLFRKKLSVRSPEMLVSCHITARSHKPEAHNVILHRLEYLKTGISLLVKANQTRSFTASVNFSVPVILRC